MRGVRLRSLAIAGGGSLRGASVQKALKRFSFEVSFDVDSVAMWLCGYVAM